MIMVLEIDDISDGDPVELGVGVTLRVATWLTLGAKNPDMLSLEDAL